MTNEQCKVLNHAEKRTVNYERIDSTTGEVIEQKARVNAEPHYIKLYYETFLAFHEIKDVPADFLAQLGPHMQYIAKDAEKGDNTKCLVYLGDVITKDIARKLDVSLTTVKRYIGKAKDTGILIPYEEEGKRKKGYYYTNPYIIAKGEWDGIKKLRANIDFIGNKWSVEIEKETATTAE